MARLVFLRTTATTERDGAAELPGSSHYTTQKWAGLVTRTLQSDTSLRGFFCCFFFSPPCGSDREEGKFLRAVARDREKRESGGVFTRRADTRRDVRSGGRDARRRAALVRRPGAGLLLSTN